MWKKITLFKATINKQSSAELIIMELVIKRSLDLQTTNLKIFFRPAASTLPSLARFAVRPRNYFTRPIEMIANLINSN